MSLPLGKQCIDCGCELNPGDYGYNSFPRECYACMMRDLIIRTVCRLTGKLTNLQFYGTLKHACRYAINEYDSTLNSVYVFEGGTMHFGLIQNKIWSPSDPDTMSGFPCAYMGGSCSERVETKGGSCIRHQFPCSIQQVRPKIAGIPYTPCANHECFAGCDYDSIYCRSHS